MGDGKSILGPDSGTGGLLESRKKNRAKRGKLIEKPPRAVWDHLALVMQVGLTFVGSVLFCFAIGYWLDKWLGTTGIFITVFLLLGIAGGGYKVWSQITELDITPEDEAQNQNPENRHDRN